MIKVYFDNAAYNLRCHKSGTLRILINLIIISMLLVAWITLRTAIGKANDKYTKGYRSTCIFTVPFYLNSDTGEYPDKYTEAVSDMNGWEELSDPFLYTELYMDDFPEGDSYSSKTNRFMTMVCDDQVYRGIDDYSYYPPSIDTQERENGRSIQFRVGVLVSDSLFCGACLEEYQYKNEADTPVLYGREPQNSKEIMISDFMLHKYGILRDEETFLGKNVSFFHDNGTVLDQVTIVGIIDGEFFREYGTMNLPQIWTAGDEEYIFENAYVEIQNCYTVDTFKNIDVVVERYEEMGLRVDDGMVLTYDYDVYNGVILPCREITSVDILVNKIGTLFGGLIILSLLLHLYNIFTQRAVDRMQYNGILRAVGMRRGGILQIGFYELLYIALVSVAIGVFCSAGLVLILNEYVGSLILFRLELNALDFVGIAATALGILLLLMFFMQYIILHTYLRKQPIQLLHS